MSELAVSLPASTPPLSDRLCSLSAMRDAQDPIGSVSKTEGLLFIEVPTPWGESFYDGDPAGTLQGRVRAVLDESYERRKAAGNDDPEWGYRGVYAIAPDREWSAPGQRRAILALRPRRPFAQYEVTEFRFATAGFEPVRLVDDFINDRYSPGEHADFIVERQPLREYFVCTHGHVDICCAKFGVPLYNTLRELPGVRAWRTSHFGGHRFAPTVKEFPAGYTWGFVDAEVATSIAARRVAPSELARNVRGWSGVEGPLQPLDRVGLERFGWDWLEFTRNGTIDSGGDDEGRWEGTVTYTGPGGAPGVIRGTVVRGRELSNLGCGANWGEPKHESPEYRLEEVVVEALPAGVERMANRLK